ncbi:Ubiquitin carboxyl-terminal hydrolase 23 [Porphyridium purpureum]|uniref:ubiquitinyl hydrolase 1 n=1 Tax=Porphyridium purpureum TaxID=35688 RepID=A0A5J4Z4I3_PORPP|nr:Ubiquitin carboxyl-terminal hydrolase 23 [Porphyridium purpureum]|eukprot:POR0934..scf295_1
MLGSCCGRSSSCYCCCCWWWCSPCFLLQEDTLDARDILTAGWPAGTAAEQLPRIKFVSASSSLCAARHAHGTVDGDAAPAMGAAKLASRRSSQLGPQNQSADASHKKQTQLQLVGKSQSSPIAQPLAHGRRALQQESEHELQPRGSSSAPDLKQHGGSEQEQSIGFGGQWITPLGKKTPLEWSERGMPTGDAAFQFPAKAILNLGNTCYLNASLQCLLHCAPFAVALATSAHRDSCQIKQTFCAQCFLESFAHSMYSGSNTKPAVLAPKAMVSNIRSICRSFRVGHQEDAHEFIRHLLDCVIKNSLGLKNAHAARLSLSREFTSFVHSIFGGCLQNEVRCESCGHVSMTTQPFLDLSLEVGPRTTSVQQSLELFFKAERLDGSNKYRCSSCKKLVVATKRLAVRRAPNVLSLHLKRFDGARKNNRYIEYGHVVSLERGMPPEYAVALRNGKIISRQNGKHGNVDDANVCLKYRLSGVVVHDGSSVHSGHYFAYVKEGNGKWFLKDDSRSQQVSDNAALKQRAYLLFFVRMSAAHSQQERSAKLVNGVYDDVRRSNTPSSTENDHKDPLDDDDESSSSQDSDFKVDESSSDSGSDSSGEKESSSESDIESSTSWSSNASSRSTSSTGSALKHKRRRNLDGNETPSSSLPAPSASPTDTLERIGSRGAKKSKLQARDHVEPASVHNLSGQNGGKAETEQSLAIVLSPKGSTLSPRERSSTSSFANIPARVLEQLEKGSGAWPVKSVTSNFKKLVAMWMKSKQKKSRSLSLNGSNGSNGSGSHGLGSPRSVGKSQSPSLAPSLASSSPPRSPASKHKRETASPGDLPSLPASPSNAVTSRGTVFQDDGVGGWDLALSDDGGAGHQKHGPQTTSRAVRGLRGSSNSSSIVKRARMSESWDAEYDKGKQRKVRNRNGGGAVSEAASDNSLAANEDVLGGKPAGRLENGAAGPNNLFQRRQQDKKSSGGVRGGTGKHQNRSATMTPTGLRRKSASRGARTGSRGRGRGRG